MSLKCNKVSSDEMDYIRRWIGNVSNQNSIRAVTVHRPVKWHRAGRKVAPFHYQIKLIQCKLQTARVMPNIKNALCYKMP